MIASFRDPDGRLLMIDGRVIRIIKKSAAPDLRAALASKSSNKFLSEGKLVRTRFLAAAEAERLSEREEVQGLLAAVDESLLVEHERITFPSFPYEWPPEMLYAAAELTLDMAEALLSESLGLKDATPYNVLYRGAVPVFIDLLSFERRDPRDHTWPPFAQFSRTFLRPLLINKYYGVRLDQIFINNRDGLYPEDIERFCGPLQKLRPSFFTLVTLPAYLSRPSHTQDSALYRKRTTSSSEKAQFILSRIFKSLHRQLKSVRPVESRCSNWSRYMEQNNYSADYFPAKQQFVERALSEAQPRKVLDVGCNTGHFSALAARLGASVVALDSDPVVVGKLWLQASTEALDILPLVVNLAWPTPSIGWRNNEYPSFLERAGGAFDAVLMLAVIHHMLVTERIPLEEIMRLAEEITTDLLIIEYIPPDDPMFRLIVRGREHLHETLTRDYFEAVSREHFELVRSEQLAGTQRWLYLMRKKHHA